MSPRLGRNAWRKNWQVSLPKNFHLHIEELMKQLLIEIDEETFAKLEQIAPAKSRRRSAFIRGAITRALCEAQEELTAAAYRRLPDSAEDAWFDAHVWEPKAPSYRSRKRR